MKNLLILTFVTMIAGLSTNVQASHENDRLQTAVTQSSDTAKTRVQVQIYELLLAYYKIKDALVASNANKASIATTTFDSALKLITINQMTAEEGRLFAQLGSKLGGDVQHIQAASGIEQIRESFASLSDNMYALVKAFKANNGQTVYFDYCPMKDRHWLSAEKAIKNPCYGKQMLTCGSIEETIK